jgi:hypothetical protein
MLASLMIVDLAAIKRKAEGKVNLSSRPTAL